MNLSTIVLDGGTYPREPRPDDNLSPRGDGLVAVLDGVCRVRRHERVELVAAEEVFMSVAYCLVSGRLEEVGRHRLPLNVVYICRVVVCIQAGPGTFVVTG